MIRSGDVVDYSTMRKGRRRDPMGRIVIITECARCGKKGHEGRLQTKPGTLRRTWTHSGVFAGFFFSVREYCMEAKAEPV